MQRTQAMCRDQKAAVLGLGRLLSAEITHFNQTIRNTSGRSPSDLLERPQKKCCMVAKNDGPAGT
jgi:hypothetical protein